MDRPWRSHPQQSSEASRGQSSEASRGPRHGGGPVRSLRPTPPPVLHCRRAKSAGNDVELGIDASNLVYDMTWAAL
eukprot:4091405-Pyramimonas_sp.AAC.1